MEIQDIPYVKRHYFETNSGNKICKQSIIYAPENIILSGQVIVKPGAILRGDLGNIKIGRNCVINNDVVIRPSFTNIGKLGTFFPALIGKYVFIEENSIIYSGTVGSFVHIGKNCVIGQKCQLQDCCIIDDNSILAPETVIPSFTRWGGSPAHQIDVITNSQQLQMEQFTKTYYEHFKPMSMVSPETNRMANTDL